MEERDKQRGQRDEADHQAQSAGNRVWLRNNRDAKNQHHGGENPEKQRAHVMTTGSASSNGVYFLSFHL